MMNVAYSSYSRPMKVGATSILVWALLVWPFQWHLAYAEGLPGDNAAAELLMNKRSQKLGNGQSEGSGTVRMPRIMPDTTPIRTPNLNPGASDAELAQKAADKHAPLQVGDLVKSAQENSDFAQGIYGSADVSNYYLDTERSDPELNQKDNKRVNITEIMPGFNSTDIAIMREQGKVLYENPAKIKEVAEQNKRNLRRSGCRKTNFILLDRQDIYQAPISASHRILKIEFFDIHKEPIPDTNPVKYKEVQVQSVYRKGQVKLEFKTLGASSAQWMDRVDDSFGIRYTYTPYSAPKGLNYFTYNHRVAVDGVNGYQVMPDNYVVSFGTPKDGFTPTLGYDIQHGVSAIYLSADLYRTEVNYTEPDPNIGCEPDPPANCEVPSNGGTMLRWCSGSPGAGIMMMYDDASNPTAQAKAKSYSDMFMGNAGSKNYKNDAGVIGGVMRNLNAGSSNLAQELAGHCSRESISRIEMKVDNSYHNENINICSETLVNPYPRGCHTIKRSFGLAHLGNHNYLTVRAFNKIAVPVIDPRTGQQVKDASGRPVFTYRREPANVSGAVNTNFAIMGSSTCSAGGCSTEKLPDNPDGSSAGYYLEYSHTPMSGDPYAFAVNGVTVQGGGSASFSHYGSPTANWKPSGSASGDGSLHELRLMADMYSVTINQFAGCENYMNYVSDGFCLGGKLTCVDTAPTRSIGGVTFGPSLPNSGIVDILKKWGTESTAEFPDYENGEGDGPTPTGPENVMLSDKMCWEAVGEPFTSCSAMGEDLSRLKTFNKGDQVWGTDCHITKGPDGAPLESSSSCKRQPEYDGCDARFKGLYSGLCYIPTIAYDCGTTVSSQIPLIVEEKGDSCSGAMRCMGTQCHRPNLTGSESAEFAKAASGMEALNMMKMDMVCAETGEPPINTSDTCTPVVFGGKAMYCKIPVGNEIGITPNCCDETVAAAASGGPNWMDYLKGTYLIYKIGQNKIMQDMLAGNDIYNSTAKMFGEIAKPISDAYASASQFVTENFVDPLSAGFDNLFAEFGASSGTETASQVGVDLFGKDGLIGGVINELEQMLLKNAYEILQQTIGEEAASAIITPAATSGGTYALTQGAQQVVQAVNMVFMVYSLARLIGHIVFACKQEEYEWAMNMKWKLCTYVGDCCAKKGLIGDCLEKRKLYCCYKSIAARIIADQIIKKNLLPSRQYGYRTSVTGGKLKKCSINCGGFTPMELVTVDWSKVDLSEWLSAMADSGIINPSDPRTNFGVSQNKVEITQAVGRTEDKEGKFDQRIAAVKTVEGLKQNTQNLMNNTAILRKEGHCYQVDEKMPYTYPECKATDCGNVLGSASNATTVFGWTEDTATGDWILTFGAKEDDIYPDGSHDLSGTINIKDKSKLTKFVFEWLAYDDWLNMKINGHQIWNGPEGDIIELCQNGRVKIYPNGGCDRRREIYGPHDVRKGGQYPNVDILPYIKNGANELSVRLIVGGRGDFSARFRTHQDCSAGIVKP